MIHSAELLASVDGSCSPYEQRQRKAREVVCAEQSQQVHAAQTEVSSTEGRRSDNKPAFGSFAPVDMTKALVLLADSHILETCFAQAAALTA